MKVQDRFEKGHIKAFATDSTSCKDQGKEQPTVNGLHGIITENGLVPTSSITSRAVEKMAFTKMADSVETTLLIKQEAFVYKIPSQQNSSAGFKANGWNLEKPDWTGKLRVVSSGKDCCLRLEEKPSGKLYAQCPVDVYPGQAVQTVSDSSRYFVIRVRDEGGRNAHLGLGFADRSDSFDLNVALQDHFKSVRVEEAIEKEAEVPVEQLDLAFKEGQTIKVNINIPRKDGRERSRSPAHSGGVLPPPSAASTAAAMTQAGIRVDSQPRIAAPPAKQANPNWIQF